MPAITPPNLSELPWEKAQEIRRIVPKLRSLPKAGDKPRRRDIPELNDCQHLFLHLAYETANAPDFSASAKDLFRYLRANDGVVKSKEAADLIRPLMSKLRTVLTAADHDPDVEQSEFRIFVRDDNDAGTGIRIRFRPRPTKPGRPRNQTTTRHTAGAVGLWRKLAGSWKLRKGLLIYDTPAAMKVEVPDLKSRAVVEVQAQNNRGLWARSGDIAAVFNVGNILLQLNLPTRVLRWRDIRPDDVKEHWQYIVMIGNSSHAWLDLMKTRVEWQPRRSYIFTEIVGREACARIEDARMRDDAASTPVVYEHESGSAGDAGTDYAVFSFYKDIFHKQLLIGITGTSGAASRELALFVSDDERTVDLEEFLEVRRKLPLSTQPRAFEVLFKLTLRDGLLERISPIDAVVYES